MSQNEVMDILELIEKLHEENCSCVISCKEKMLCFGQRGIKDLFQLYNNCPGKFVGEKIADKVVGKGAAALMELIGFNEVYADVISRPALELLGLEGVKVGYGQLCDNIVNRAGDGICPVETICMEFKTASECLPGITRFIERMNKNN